MADDMMYNGDMMNTKMNRLIVEALPAMTAAVRGVLWNSFPSAVDDVVNSACVSLINSAETFDHSRPFAPWAVVVARNEALRLLKRSENHGHTSEVVSKSSGEAVPLLDTVSSNKAQYGFMDSPDGRAEVSRMMDREWLTRAMARLTDEERTFIEAIADGSTQTEAGALVGWSPATATRRRRDIAAKMARWRDER